MSTDTSKTAQMERMKELFAESLERATSVFGEMTDDPDTDETVTTFTITAPRID